MEAITRRQAISASMIGMLGAGLLGRGAQAAYAKDTPTDAGSEKTASVTVGGAQYAYPASWACATTDSGATLTSGELTVMLKSLTYAGPDAATLADAAAIQATLEQLAGDFADYGGVTPLALFCGSDDGMTAELLEAVVPTATELPGWFGFTRARWADGKVSMLIAIGPHADVLPNLASLCQAWESAWPPAAGSVQDQAESAAPDAAAQPATASAPAATMGQQNAVAKAKNYLKFMAFSHDGLVEQLEFEGFSADEATYGADNCGADWNEQAAQKAKNYLDMMSFSRDGLIEQLEFEGFTPEQAEYGVTAVGY